MIAEKALHSAKNRADSLLGKVPPKKDSKRYCGVCPACKILKSMPSSSPERIAEVLKRDRASLSYQECIAGFLQENYGNIFTQRALENLYKPAASEAKAAQKAEDKKILRSHISEKVEDKDINEKFERKGAGSYLDYKTRSFMESRTGQYFGDVRIHTDSLANKNAKDLNAHAYTMGKDIFFASNKYKPETMEGKKLLAHELVHAAQNKDLSTEGGNKAFPYKVSSPNDTMERHADAAASKVVKGHSMPLSKPMFQSSAKTIHRKAEGEERESGWLTEKLAEYASDIPGFTLISFILGKNPITGKPVERNARTFLEAVFGLIPGGALLFKNLNESGAIDEFFDWINKEIKALNITWEFIKGLIGKAWAILKEGVLLLGISEKIKKIIALFVPVYERIKAFFIAVGKKVMDFIFEAILKKLGAEKLLEVLKKVGDVIGIIAADPIKFLKNLLGALKKGFNQFVSNIWEHLKTGLMGWLFGALASAGITVPKSFDPKSIFGLVMQILGITKEFIRKKAAKIIGEKNVELIEKAWSFISTLISSGIAGLWEMMKEYVGNLKDIVIGAIQDWVVTKIITMAITKLVQMFNPVGAIITAVQTIYNTVMFFIERMQQILALVDAIIQSILSIAQGAIDNAADWIEKTMARTLPVIISFLARLIGLGGISDKIREIIKKLQAKVEAAVDKVIDKVAAKVKGLLGKILPGKKEKPMSPEVKKRWDAGMAEIEALQKRAEKDPEDEEEIKKHLTPIKSKYGFKKLDAKLEGDEWVVDAEMNPKENKKVKAQKQKKRSDAIKEINGKWCYPITWPNKFDTGTFKSFATKNNYKPEKVVPTKRTTVTRNDGKVNYEVGVNPKILPSTVPLQKVFQRNKTARGEAVKKEWNKFRNSTEKLSEGGKKSGYEMQHAHPLFLNGPDDSENLWPLEFSIHRSGHEILKHQEHNLLNLTIVDKDGKPTGKTFQDKFATGNIEDKRLEGLFFYVKDKK